LLVCLLFIEQRIFFLLLRNANAKRSVHKNQPLVSVLGHINPMFNHTQSLSLKYNIIMIISVPRLLCGLLSSGFHLKLLYSLLTFALRTTSSKPFILCFLLILKIFVTNTNYETLDYVNFLLCCFLTSLSLKAFRHYLAFRHH